MNICKYKNFEFAQQVCNFINEHPFIEIVGIVNRSAAYTLFYKEKQTEK